MSNTEKYGQGVDGEKQGSIEGKSLGFQISLKFKSWLYHLLPM